MKRSIITLEEARKIPALSSTTNASYLSEKYVKINTIDVIEQLATTGWNPVSIKGTNTRNSNPHSFHIIRFANEKLPLDLKDGNIELVLTNSHDGTTAFKFYLGVYRLVCSNGMVVSNPIDQFSTKHIGANTHKEVIEVVSRIIDESNMVVSTVDKMKNLNLTPTQKTDLSKAAIQLKFNNPNAIDSKLILEPRRDIDKGNDLWSTFNVIQENITKGGLQYTSESGRNLTTRPINGAHMDFLFNTNLWKHTVKTFSLS